ncbi:imidazolonepropionase-like domain-containing protein [Streptomyces sp. NPDC050560]|uniref:imidazolonepropionase-like domain-containing protein n=1 Tax=Streptomyces sp. NPDC050560 TaxID=3365630 RepID=UPI0037B4A506
MLTLHTAPLLRTTDAREGEGGEGPLPDGAVAVLDGRIEAIGPLARLTVRYPAARVRRWPGTLGPGLVHRTCVPSAPSPRERVYAMLRLGATAVLAEQVTEPALRDAARYGGVRVLSAARPPRLAVGGPADLAVFDDDGGCVATVLGGRVLHRRV